MESVAGVAAFSLVRGCLVATVLHDLDAEGARRFHADLSDRLQRDRVLGVVLDVSALSVMDEQDFDWVRNALRISTLMGKAAVLAAITPEVAATLVRLGVDVGGVRAAQSVDHALELLLGARA